VSIFGAHAISSIVVDVDFVVGHPMELAFLYHHHLRIVSPLMLSDPKRISTAVLLVFLLL